MVELIINPEYEKLIPPLPKTDREELKKSIDQDGLYYSIIINEKQQILDGHHRYAICQELHKEFATEIKTFKTPLEERKFVIKSNFNRRHLELHQRLALADELHKIALEEGKARVAPVGATRHKPKRKKDTRIRKRPPEILKEQRERKTIAKAAKQTHVGATTLRKYQHVLKHGSPELAQKVKDGWISPTKGVQLLENEKIQKKLLADNPTSIKPEEIPVVNADFFEWVRNIKPNSIDFMFTDPPYGKEAVIPIYSKLAIEAERILKPGSSVVTYLGMYTLPEVLELFKAAKLKFWWSFAIKYAGARAQMYQRRLFVDWKFLAWFVKGDISQHPEPPHDFIDSEIPDKSIHPWAQSSKEAEYIISKLTTENQEVLDPFAGSGVTGIAAIKLGRRFKGTEIDKIKCDIANSNIVKFKKSLEELK